MDDDVLLPDRRKAIAAEIADALGKARVVGGEDEIGALVAMISSSVSLSPRMPSVANTSAGAASSFSTQKTAQIGRHRRIDREMDRMAAAAALQRRLVQADQILGFLLDLDLAVAQQAEDALRDDGKTREQMIEKQRDHLLDRQKADAAAGQADESVDRGRDQGQRLQADTVADPFELERQAEAAIGDERERDAPGRARAASAPERPRP